MYLTQPTFRENFNFDIFLQKRLLLTFAYGFEKSVIYEKLSTQKVTSDFLYVLEEKISTQKVIYRFPVCFRIKNQS
jgi:hypothetical protein